jgi:hypothetical protein
MVLFPTPSNRKRHQTVHVFLFLPTAHHPRLEECAHPVAFPKIMLSMAKNEFVPNEDEGAEEAV